MLMSTSRSAAAFAPLGEAIDLALEVLALSMTEDGDEVGVLVNDHDNRLQDAL